MVGRDAAKDPACREDGAAPADKESDAPEAVVAAELVFKINMVTV